MMSLFINAWTIACPQGVGGLPSNHNLAFDPACQGANAGQARFFINV